MTAALKAAASPLQVARRVRWRWDVVGDGRALPWGDRLRYAVLNRPGLDDLLAKRVRRDPDGRPYFDLPAGTVHFLPRDRPVADEAAALRGALLIVREAYCGSSEFFHGSAQLRPGDVALDLGGNLGTSAITFARIVGKQGRVYSFEPVFHDLLRLNCANNGIAEIVEAVPTAVGESVGEVRFAVTDTGIDSRAAPPGKEQTDVFPQTSVDAFVAERGLDRLDFIKMDVEGAEEPALLGGRETIRRFQPKFTIASYHTDIEGRRQHPRLLKLLGELGYATHELPGRHIYAWPR